MSDKSRTVIIVAGGKGERMQRSVPKQFLTLHRQPVLMHTLRCFYNFNPAMKIIVVIPEAQVERWAQLCLDQHFEVPHSIVAGGSSRFDSVKNGLALVEDEAIVFVHDGVRCLVSKELIHRCYEQAVETGTAIPSITSSDSIRIITEEGNEAFDRTNVKLIQTPQTFHSKIILPAFQIDYKDKFTDEATVAEAYGIKVSLVEGEESNIKITKPIDLLIAERVLADRSTS